MSRGARSRDSALLDAVHGMPDSARSGIARSTRTSTAKINAGGWHGGVGGRRRKAAPFILRAYGTDRFLGASAVDSHGGGGDRRAVVRRAAGGGHADKGPSVSERALRADPLQAADRPQPQ